MQLRSRFNSAFEGVRACVTGGAGFIGSHLVDALVELGADVVVIDDLSNGREENLNLVENSIMFLRRSILDEDALRQAVSGCSVIFHQAALGSVPASVDDPAHYHDVNATGTVRVLEAARAEGVPRVVYAASSSAYGDSEELPKVESMAPRPCSPYAATKLAGEDLLSAYAACYGIAGASLRYFNIFGARQRPDSQYAAVIPAFAKALAEGQPPVIYGDGKQSRDFTHIDNVVLANLIAGSASVALRGETMNIACGERYTLLQLLDAMGEILGVRPEPVHKPARTGDVMHSEADITRARALLGYEVVTDLHAGLLKTLRSVGAT